MLTEEEKVVKVIKRRGQKSAEVIATVGCRFHDVSCRYRCFETFYSIPRLNEIVSINNGKFSVKKVVHICNVSYTTLEVEGVLKDASSFEEIDQRMLMLGWEKYHEKSK